jgi:selenocysteine lyase/cysteine desulfurase
VTVFSFVLAGYSPANIPRHLDSRAIAIRADDLAALPLLRASCYLHKRTSDLDRLASALRELTGMENSR